MDGITFYAGMVEVLAAQAPVQRIRTAGGELTMFNPAGATALIVMTGRMEAVHAEAITVVGQRLLEDQPGAHASFHDYSDMTGYDSSARLTLTRWGEKTGKRVPEIHVLTTSKLVAMGVSAAGLALSLVGTDLSSYTGRAEFEAALEARIAEARGRA